jgi:hypothetical protein
MLSQNYAAIAVDLLLEKMSLEQQLELLMD